MTLFPDTDSIILLGAPATHPETDDGWIEAEAALSSRAHNGLLRVKRFVEKPSKQVARDLWNRGCAWNTFVMAGRAETFLNVIRSTAAELWRPFEIAHARSGLEVHAARMEVHAARMEVMMNAIYAGLPVSDLSTQVLASCPEKLRVLCLGNVGWSDVGNPRRLIEVLSRNGEKNDWIPLWQKEKMKSSSSHASRSIGPVAGIAGTAS
jgi:mannose-1-phosphate guanylyltransferase